MQHTEVERQTEQVLFEEFIVAKRTAEAASVFFHVKGDEGGRYPLTGVGDVNTYALFSESILQMTSVHGRSGFIVPTGIATDDSTKAFFGNIAQSARLVSLYDFENREAIFESVHRSYKFCLLTLGQATKAEFVFFATQVNQVYDSRRRFGLTPEEFRLINPNTLTCPVFRSERDAELTKKLYRNAPVLINESKEDGNPWGISFMAMIHMSNDSHLFSETPMDGFLPLYEAKMIHQYDHRWAIYEGDSSRDSTVKEKNNFNFEPDPRYWLPTEYVLSQLQTKDWNRKWLLCWRDICRSTDKRTLISTVVPFVATTGANLVISKIETKYFAVLLSCFNSIVCDFVVRQKIGGRVTF